MVENLIAGYLATGKRLVIPELGAFLKKETGETVFVEFLKKDDGVFAELISQSLGIPVADAAAQAALFSAEVRDSLSGRGFFIIPRVGTMRRDGSGAIVLTPTVTEEAPATQSAVQEPAPAPAQTTPVAPAAEPQPKVVPYTPLRQKAKVEHYAATSTPETAPPTAQPQPTTAQQPAREPAVQPRVQPRPEPAIKPIPRPQAATAPMGEDTQRRTHTAQPHISGEPQRRPQRPPVNVPQKKKTDLIMIIAIIAALVAIGSMVFGLLVNSDPIGNIQPTSPQQEQVVPALDDNAGVAEGEAGE